MRGCSKKRYFQVTTRRNRKRGRRRRMMNWKQWYQMQQMYSTIFFLISPRFSTSSYQKKAITYLQAKEPLNSMAELIVEHTQQQQTPMHPALARSTIHSLIIPRQYLCERTINASMKTRQKLSLYSRVFDSCLRLADCYSWSVSFRSTRRAMACSSSASSSWQTSLRVLVYQFPNLMTAGMTAMMMKKLIRKTRPKRLRQVMKSNLRLKMISRCFTQSWTTCLMP